MKRSLGTELCYLLGPDGGTGIFGGKKAAPFCGRVGSIAFPRVAMMPFRNNTRRRKKTQYFADSCHHWKTNWFESLPPVFKVSCRRWWPECNTLPLLYLCQMQHHWSPFVVGEWKTIAVSSNDAWFMGGDFLSLKLMVDPLIIMRCWNFRRWFTPLYVMGHALLWIERQQIHVV